MSFRGDPKPFIVPLDRARLTAQQLYYLSIREHQSIYLTLCKRTKPPNIPPMFVYQCDRNKEASKAACVLERDM